jgi:hypothetical protein
MVEWDTKDYNNLYKDYVYVIINEEKVPNTVYLKTVLQRYKITNNSKSIDKIIKVYSGIFQKKYYKWYDNTYIRIKK